MSLNDTWAVAYSPSLKMYRAVHLMEILSVNYQAHERGEDTDFILLAVAASGIDAQEVAEGIMRQRNSRVVGQKN